MAIKGPTKAFSISLSSFLNMQKIAEFEPAGGDTDRGNEIKNIGTKVQLSTFETELDATIRDFYKRINLREILNVFF